MPLLEFSHYQKYDKTPFIICTDLERLLEKINPENSSTTTVR